MKFFLFKKNIIAVKISIILFIFTTNSYGFTTFLQNIFSTNVNLLKLEKQLNEKNGIQTLSPLESALLDNFTDKNQLKIAIIKEKNTIILRAIAYYFSVLENKQLRLLHYDLNSEFIKLYKAQPKNTLEKYDKQSLAKAVAKLNQANTRLKEQNQVYKQSLTSFLNYTGQNFSQTNLETIINKINIPQSYDDAYQKYNSKDELTKQAISNVLKVEDSKNIKPHIQKYYRDYVELIVLYKNKLHALRNNTVKENLLLQLKENESSFLSQQELIKLKYKILFQKVKISFISADLLEIINNFPSKNTPKIEKLKLRRVNFLPNSTKLSSYSMNTLKENVKKLAKIENFIIELHGYSDSMGDTKTNEALTKKRLKNVKQDMLKLGIDESKITLHVKLDSQPIASNKTKQGRLLNRRIEFKIYEDKR